MRFLDFPHGSARNHLIAIASGQCQLPGRSRVSGFRRESSAALLIDLLPAVVRPQLLATEDDEETHRENSMMPATGIPGNQNMLMSGNPERFGRFECRRSGDCRCNHHAERWYWRRTLSRQLSLLPARTPTICRHGAAAKSHRADLGRSTSARVQRRTSSNQRERLGVGITGSDLI